MTNPTPDLLPCPFCGATPLAYDRQTMIDGEFYEKLGCDNRECPVFPSTWHLPVADTIAAWNTRTPTPAVNAGAVKVKPLVWVWRSGDICEAQTPWGKYFAQWDDELCAFFASLELGEHEDPIIVQPQDVASMSEAQAAAQADFETRILSALDVQPDPRDEVIARLVEAVQAYVSRSEEYQIISADRGSSTGIKRQAFIAVGNAYSAMNAALASAKEVMK